MPEWLFQVLCVAGASISVYVGIRADLAAMKAQIEGLTHAANHAHRRIDDLLLKGNAQ